MGKGSEARMKSKAWVIMPHTIRKGDNGIEVENEIFPLVMCCDCEHYDGIGTCMKNGIVLPTDHWFCADGSKD